MPLFVQLCLGSHAKKAEFNSIAKSMQFTRLGKGWVHPQYDAHFFLGKIMDGTVDTCKMKFLTEDNKRDIALGVAKPKQIKRFGEGSYTVRKSADIIIASHREKVRGPEYITVTLWADYQNAK